MCVHTHTQTHREGKKGGGRGEGKKKREGLGITDWSGFPEKEGSECVKAQEDKCLLQRSEGHRVKPQSSQ